MKHLFKPLHQPTFASISLLILRLVVGVAFVIYGQGKIQNPFGWMGPDSGYPGILLFLAALSEFGGGIALILGLVTPLALFGILCTMVVATYVHAVVAGDPFINMSGGASYAIAVVFLAIMIVFIGAGPGKYSLDRFIFGEKQN